MYYWQRDYHHDNPGLIRTWSQEEDELNSTTITTATAPATAISTLHLFICLFIYLFTYLFNDSVNSYGVLTDRINEWIKTGVEESNHGLI